MNVSSSFLALGTNNHDHEENGGHTHQEQPDLGLAHTLFLADFVAPQ